MNEMSEMTRKKDSLILLNKTQRSKSVKWSELPIAITHNHFGLILPSKQKYENILAAMFDFEINWELLIWKVLKDIQKSLLIASLQIRHTGFFAFTKLGRITA